MKGKLTCEDGRKARAIYPWKKLEHYGSYFIWPDKSKYHSIYTGAVKQGFKVSIRKHDDGILVIRVN